MNMYSVVVKIDGIESRRRSAGLLHIIIGFFLILKSITYIEYLVYKDVLPVFPFLLIGCFSIFYGLFRKKIDFTYHYNYWLRLLQVLTFTALGMIMVKVGETMDYVGVFAFAFLSMLLLFSERKIFQETALLMDEAGITIPGYYRDHLVKWQELTDVTVREDFITLFHIKQKYLQYQVIQDLSAIEVAKMNDYCREMIGSTITEVSRKVEQ